MDPDGGRWEDILCSVRIREEFNHNWDMQDINNPSVIFSLTLTDKDNNMATQGLLFTLVSIFPGMILIFVVNYIIILLLYCQNFSLISI